MRDLFPLIPTPPEEKTAQLPLYRDIAMDYQNGTPIFSGGNPLIVEGVEAVKGWAFRMLQTARYRYAHFSWDIGSELDALVGQPYREDTKLSEAGRYIFDTLMVSPYITNVQVTRAAFQDATLTLEARVETVYGEVTLNV